MQLGSNLTNLCARSNKNARVVLVVSFENKDNTILSYQRFTNKLSYLIANLGLNG